jgi:hypothetical protein
MTNTATKFDRNASKLAAALKGREFDPFYVAVTDAPVWQHGEQVAFMTGTFPAAKVHGQTVVLLDNGEVSMLADWRVEAVIRRVRMAVAA